MLALTVRPPSSHAIAEGWQTIESRDWAPQRRGLLAIHAGTHWDWRAHRRIERLTPAADLSTTVTGAVVAVAVLSGVHHSGSCRRLGRYAELHPDGPVLAFTAQEWTDFVASLCAPVSASHVVQTPGHQDTCVKPSTAATAPHSGHPRPTDDRNEDR